MSQSFLNEIQIDLRQLNLGKPLFKPSSKTGAAMSLHYAHLFNTHEGIKFAINAQYWQFGEVTRNINNFGQVSEITESASESTTDQWCGILFSPILTVFQDEPRFFG